MNTCLNQYTTSRNSSLSGQVDFGVSARLRIDEMVEAGAVLAVEERIFEVRTPAFEVMSRMALAWLPPKQA
jgi:hypothetical protein